MAWLKLDPAGPILAHLLDQAWGSLDNQVLSSSKICSQNCNVITKNIKNKQKWRQCRI